jgi:hypothetical protein
MSNDDPLDNDDASADATATVGSWIEEAATTEEGLDLDSLSGRERGALKRTRTMGTLLDDAIPIPGVGYRVGIDPILGLLPVSGDLAGAVLSAYIIAEAALVGVPPKTLGRMALNVAADTLVGSIPVAGDLFDAVWKANERNVALFEAHLADRTDVPIE